MHEKDRSTCLTMKHQATQERCLDIAHDFYLVDMGRLLLTISQGPQPILLQDDCFTQFNLVVFILWYVHIYILRDMYNDDMDKRYFNNCSVHRHCYFQPHIQSQDKAMD